MLPNTVIRIKKNGDHTIESLERSDMCFKLKDMAKSAGKIKSETDKEHPPIFQNVHLRGE